MLSLQNRHGFGIRNDRRTDADGLRFAVSGNLQIICTAAAELLLQEEVGVFAAVIIVGKLISVCVEQRSIGVKIGLRAELVAGIGGRGDFVDNDILRAVEYGGFCLPCRQRLVILDSDGTGSGQPSFRGGGNNGGNNGGWNMGGGNQRTALVLQFLRQETDSVAAYCGRKLTLNEAEVLGYPVTEPPFVNSICSASGQRSSVTS